MKYFARLNYQHQYITASKIFLRKGQWSISARVKQINNKNNMHCQIGNANKDIKFRNKISTKANFINCMMKLFRIISKQKISKNLIINKQTNLKTIRRKSLLLYLLQIKNERVICDENINTHNNIQDLIIIVQ